MKNKILPIICIAVTLFGGKIKAVTNDTTCVTIAASSEQTTIITTQLPSTNQGASNIFYCATWTCGGTCLDRGLMQFDLSSIPINATITSASLSLYADNSAVVGMAGQPTYGSNNAAWLQRVTSTWTYNTVTWNTQPTTTTTDEVTLAQSSGTSENYMLNITQLIKDIITSGNNYGFELVEQNETTPYQSLIFGSNSNTNTSIQPQLKICYVLPNDTHNDSCISLNPYDTNGTVLGTQSPNAPGIVSDLFYSATWTCSGPTCLDVGLINFDLSSIPVNATIDSASLYLYADNSAPFGISGQPTYGSNNAGWLQRVTSAWTYNTVTWNTTPTATTTDEVTLTQSTGTSENYILNVTQLIKDIITSGNNYGFEILQQNQATPYQSLIFGSSANPNAALRPKLDICYSTSAAISSISNPDINIEVYPNPAKDKLVFKTGSSESVKNYYVHIYNMLGQEVRNFQLYPYQLTISTSDLARGMYLYKIVDNNIVLKTGKIVLQ